MSRFNHFRLKNEMLFMNYLANVIGVGVVIFMTYRPISQQLSNALMPVTRMGRIFEPVSGVLMLALAVYFEQPIRRYLDAQRDGKALSDEMTFKAKKRLLNEPFFLIGMDLAIWITAGAFYSLVLLDFDVASRTVYYTFFLSVQIGLITTVAAFFLLRSVIQRKMAPRLFPSGGLYAIPGTFRIHLGTRLAALLLACNLIPFWAVITILQGTLGSGEFSGEIFADMSSNILISSFVFMGVGILLTYQVSANLRQPIQNMIHVLKRVRDGCFDQKVSVTSNDEIGYTGDVINEMTAGLKERDRMRHSLELAKEVQQHFMPKEIPEVAGLDIAGKCIYCDRTGGDYYDFLKLPGSGDGKIGIVVGDVSGHGIAAALLMSGVRSTLRQRVLLPGNIGQIVSDVNRQLARDVEESGRFMTLFYSEIDPAKRSISWVRAGHEPAIFFDPHTDSFEELTGPGMALGVDDTHLYTQSVKENLKEQQIIVFCTDGVLEAHSLSGDMFGKDALYDVVRKNSGLPAADIVQAVVAALRQFQAGVRPEDDVTLVVVKITPFISHPALAG